MVTHSLEEPPIIMRFIGGGITPSRVRLRDLAIVMRATESLLADAVAEADSLRKSEDVLISLEDIKEGSLHLTFASPDDTVSRTFRHIANDIQHNIFSGFTDRMREALREITNFNRRYGCRTELTLAGNDTVLAQLEFDIPEQTAHLLHMTTTFYGTVTNAGGKEPDAHLSLLDGSKIVCRGTRTQVKELANRLYEVVGIIASGRYNTETNEFFQLRIDEILPYQETPIDTAIAQLAELAEPAYRDVDVDAFLAEIRASEDE